MTSNTAPHGGLYRGRFAPSPTGPLHFGSLVAAAGSYLRARQAGGRWLLRIEDIDPPREVSGAKQAIIAALEAYGFEWDGEIVYQSERIDRYRRALWTLRDTYACDCSRKRIAADGRRRGLTAGRYPGTCRGRRLPPSPGVAIRWRFDDDTDFVDRLRGQCRARHEDDDFVLWRRDDLPAYLLAVAADDGAQRITEVVRGADLLDSTAKQIALMQALGFAAPQFVHLPIVVNPEGQKLSKQTGASALSMTAPGALLCAALSVLGASPPADLAAENSAEIWRWALSNWSLKPLKGIETVALPRS